MRRLVFLGCAALLACSSVETEDGRGGSAGTTTTTPTAGSGVGSATSVASGTSSASTGGPGQLGMNDISILVPLPATDAPVLFRASDPTAEGTAIFPLDAYDAAITIPGRPGELGEFYEQLHLMAFRFDLCDRAAPGPCPAGADGSLRLVFQPVFGGTGVDLGFHVFYTVPNADVPGVVQRLRDLAALRSAPAPAAIAPATALVDEPAYHDAAHALLSDLARAPRLMRITAMGQVVISAAFRWAFHGVEVQNGSFVEMTIPDTADHKTQEVLLLNDASYELTPEIDVPAGFVLGVSGFEFDSASSDARTAAMRVLVDVENPETHTADTVQCASCHVSTVALAQRAATSGVDPATLPGVFTSPYDLSIAAGDSATDDTLIRGFGWVSNSAAISQRVVNETAHVLLEIESRFPAP